MLAVKVTKPAIPRADAFVSVNDGGGCRSAVYAYAFRILYRLWPGQRCRNPRYLCMDKAERMQQAVVYSGLTHPLNLSNAPL